MRETTPAVSPVRAAITCSCPRCGKSALFERLLNLRERCSACGLSYAFIDTGDGPAVFAIFVLGFVILGGALWLEFTYDPPVWVHILAWGIATPVVAIVLLRFLKALLIALQFKHKAEQGRLAGD